MKASQLFAGLIVVAAAAWIGSGMIGGSEPASSAPETQPQSARPPFRVAVQTVENADHARRIVLSGRTEADRRVDVVARTNGIVEKLPIRRGSVVKQGEEIAVLSDEAREALVGQAKARLEQRRAELKARLRLIETGNLAALQKPVLEAELSAAEAAFAQAEAERDRNVVRAPFDGVVNVLHVREGQALQVGSNIAEVVALEPMLAVVEIAERELGGVRVGDAAEVAFANGGTARGRVRFVSAVASPQTRTYRVDVELENGAAPVPDGITCEVALTLARVQAAAVPRSALVFSAQGQLGLRTVDDAGVVGFVPVKLAEDGLESVWVTGLPPSARVIVQGQDFVAEGQKVEPVTTTTVSQRS
ncbi:multidrug efflux system membrane fusion protein [Pseudochelatococcus lubricantis]|uniref:Multidrug efflux system membrane fusion protein n=1 Tax=Pseudochelatococcus lubricantis TaxID=1538102 RepID=A0ABX0V481_9HYPH|nr:efflux RND transporter periplasmic adaptor subunit [Pseudochelatococcus lubricantis]NIJ59398.1 multidrug efflux system membrane fusion protein [Pseudochelatococcus lubricantis]